MISAPCLTGHFFSFRALRCDEHSSVWLGYFEEICCPWDRRRSSTFTRPHVFFCNDLLILIQFFGRPKGCFILTTGVAWYKHKHIVLCCWSTALLNGRVRIPHICSGLDSFYWLYSSTSNQVKCLCVCKREKKLLSVSCIVNNKMHNARMCLTTL